MRQRCSTGFHALRPPDGRARRAPTASSALKATTAAPSLNSASPAILALIDSGTLTVLSRPSTATGSVGEISAPNTSAQGRASSKPSRPAASHSAVLATAIEMIDADAGHHADRPFLALSVAEIDMQRAGKQQEGKDAVHDRAVEIDPADRRLQRRA